MVGRAGFEPATNLLKAIASGGRIFMFLLLFFWSSSPHFQQFHYSFTIVFPGFITVSGASVGKNYRPRVNPDSS
jgi:hypothetical protein